MRSTRNKLFAHTRYTEKSVILDPKAAGQIALEFGDQCSSLTSSQVIYPQILSGDIMVISYFKTVCGIYIFLCYFIGNSKELEEQLYQYHTEIMYGRTAKELAKNMEKVFNEVHYQCLACLYR